MHWVYPENLLDAAIAEVASTEAPADMVEMEEVAEHVVLVEEMTFKLDEYLTV